MALTPLNNNATSNTTSAVTRPGRKTTASKPILATSKTIEEHLAGEDIRTDMKDSISAKKLLLSHGLILPTACNAIKQIAHALMEFSISAALGATQH
jgi:hypothetical protein